MTDLTIRLHSIGAGHYTAELRPGFEVHVHRLTSDEATCGIWETAHAPYSHRMLRGSGLLRAQDGEWRGEVAETYPHSERRVWHVSGARAGGVLRFAEAREAAP
jgi:hypothetical protein